MFARAAAAVALTLTATVIGGCGDDEGTGADAPPAPIPATEPIDSGDKPRGPGALDKLPTAQQRSAGAEVTARIMGTSEMTIDEYLVFVVSDVATFWANSFAASGQQFPTVYYSISNADTEPVPAGCGANEFFADGSALTQEGAVELIGPFYCPLDQTFYLPSGWLFDEAYGVEGREFGVAFVVAHEIAHHVQEVVGILPRKRAGEFITKQVELQADCLAGVWARTIGDRELLESDDLEEALSLAGELGNPPAPAVPLEKDHGTDAERIAAWSGGFQTGQGSQCTL